MPAHAPTPLLRPALRLAVPSIIENLLHSAVFSVDVLMLGHLGERELAASSLTSMFLWRVSMMTGSLQYGAAAYIARRWGESRFTLARTAAAHVTLLAAIFGCIVAAVLIPMRRSVFEVLGAPPEALDLACAFTLPILLIFPFLQMRVVLGASLRAAGDTLTPQLATLVVNVLNVAFNYVLIFGKFGVPAMGMAGAGIGTAAAITCGFGFLAWRTWRGVRPRHLFVAAEVLPTRDDMEMEPVAPAPVLVVKAPRARSVFTLSRRGFRPWIDTMTPGILRVSANALFEEALVTAGFFGFIKLMAGFGTTALAAHSAVSAIESFSYNAGQGFAIAASTLVGQALGRRDAELASRSMWLCVTFAIATMGGLGILYSLAPMWFLHWFSPNEAGPAFQILAVQLLLIAAVEQPFLGTTNVLGGSLRGAGDTISPSIAQLAGTIAVRIGLGWWLAYKLEMGIVGLYLATIIDWATRAAVLAACVVHGRWRRVHV